MATGSYVAEYDMSVPVVNHSTDRATVDQCMPGFTGLVIEMKWENYPEVNLEDVDAGSSLDKSIADETAESCCITQSLDTAAVVTEATLENSPDVKVEDIDESPMEYPNVSAKVRVHVIYVR